MICGGSSTRLIELVNYPFNPILVQYIPLKFQLLTKIQLFINSRLLVAVIGLRALLVMTMAYCPPYLDAKLCQRCVERLNS